MPARDVAAVQRIVGLGASVPRVDGIPKVSGTFAYGSDLWHDDMLWGHTLRSPHPRATIVSVEVAAALAMNGIHAILLADDVPGKRTYGLELDDQPVLASGEVRYQGEPVAVVAAETPEQARRAASAIHVVYRSLPAVTDMERALEDSPRIHPWGNVVRHVRIRHGDPDPKADVWVEGYYETAVQDQAPLGPEGGLAIPAEDGGVDLYVTTQWLHLDRAQIAPCLGLPEEMVRVHLAGVGGAFGSREDIHLQIHACLLALRTGRPVKMVYGREESFLGHVHRHPSRIWMRHGATRDGRLVALRARVLLDGGAYTSSSPAVLTNAATFACGPYEVNNALIDGTVVYTNNPPCGAMRGFGVVQSGFASEAQMDKLAARLGMDPTELRLRNALATGSMLPTGQVITGTAPMRTVIERCLAVPPPPPADAGPRAAAMVPGGVAGNAGRGEALRRGTGFAVSYKNVGYSEGFDDTTEVRLLLRTDQEGPVAVVSCAYVEVGQGLTTLITQMVRTELSVDRVVLLPPGTAEIGSAGSTSASRQTTMTGGAVEMACRAVREALFDRVRRSPRSEGALEGAGGSAELRLDGGLVMAGDVVVAPIEEFIAEPIEVARTFHHRPTQRFGPGGQGDIHVYFAFVAGRAVVEVDTDLGLVRVLQMAIAQDVGRALNPRALEGQIEGGTAQGLGLAVMEGLTIQGGMVRNPSFTDYLVPTIVDMPEVRSVLIEEPEPGVPFGAKGAGEPSTVVAAAAVAAALRAATGRELNRIPVRPDDLIGLAEPAASHGPPPVPEVPGPGLVAHYWAASTTG